MTGHSTRRTVTADGYTAACQCGWRTVRRTRDLRDRHADAHEIGAVATGPAAPPDNPATPGGRALTQTEQHTPAGPQGVNKSLAQKGSRDHQVGAIVRAYFRSTSGREGL